MALFVNRVALQAGSASDGCVFLVGLEFVAAGGEGFTMLKKNAISWHTHSPHPPPESVCKSYQRLIINYKKSIDL